MSVTSATSASPRTRSASQADRRAGALLGVLLLTALVAGSLLIVLICAQRPSGLVPSSNPGFFPSWLAGPLAGLLPSLSRRGDTLDGLFTYTLIGMYAAYALAIAYAPRVGRRWVVAAIVAVHVVFLLAPPLSLTDVFNYLNYGRMEVLYHLNPYAALPIAEPHADPAFMLSNWHHLLSPYGPLFTLITFALVPLGVAASFWAMKVVLALAGLAIVLLVWRCAELLGRNPARAAVFVGLNPIVLVFGLGGDHNDFITVALIMLAVYLVLRVTVAARPGAGGSDDGDGEPQRVALWPALRRALAPRALREGALAGAWSVALSRVAGGGLVAAGATAGPSQTVALGAGAGTLPAAPPLRRVGALARDSAAAWLWPLSPPELIAGGALVMAAGVKASAAILLPIAVAALLSRTRSAAQLLLGMAIAAVGVAVADYAAFGLQLPNLSTQGTLVSPESLPNLFGLLIGQGGETGTLQALMQGLLIAAVVAIALRAWRTRELVAPAAWATLALLVTLGWVLPWYVVWLLPLAALARSRALRAATLAFGVYLILVWSPLASTWYRAVGFDPAGTALGQQHALLTRQLLH